LSVSTRTGAPRSLEAIKRLARDILTPITYGRIAYLLAALPLGIVWFTFLVTAISVGLGTAITLIGIPILVGTMYAWRWFARVERRLIGALTGVQIEDPYRPEPLGAGWSRRISTRLGDPATWKDLVFLLLQLPLGIVSFTVAAVVLTLAASWIAAPAWYWSVPDGIELGITSVDTLGEAVLLVPLGLVVAFVGIPALGELGRGYGKLAGLLLGSNPDPELSAQVTELESARSRIIAAADAERRRIERDLHDGAQQRLVALSLTLRMAESRAEKGDPETANLIRNAGEEAGLALKDLRDLARGIHPAILTNRGLAAALDDLAGRATVPAEVASAPQERLPDQVEAAAYFVVSECLANVDKHAQASAATVSVQAADGQLTVLVADDGVGGADTEGGSGIQGLRDRVGALGGRLAIESPDAGGTRVHATIPLEVPVDVDEFAAPAPVVLTDEDAEALQARRTRRLRVRVGILASVAAILVLVWALTGSDRPWIVWPLLGLGFLAALDAWLVVGGRPLRASDVAAADGDRDEAIRSLRRRRRLRIDAGLLVVLNLFLIGIWIATGASYFWPVWPILGSAIALGLKSLRWTDIARERLVGDASAR
jgi:signal transduction histidine kinase